MKGNAERCIALPASNVRNDFMGKLPRGYKRGQKWLTVPVAFIIWGVRKAQIKNNRRKTGNNLSFSSLQ